MELPMNLAMKKVGPNVTFPTMMVLWGMVCACQGLQSISLLFNFSQWKNTGAVKSYSGLLACRFFLGALEGLFGLYLCIL